MGGFTEWPLFEDLLFVIKASKFTRVRRLKSAVVTSARRYIRNGILRQQLIDILYVVLFFLKVPPLKLAEWYYAYPSKAYFEAAAAIMMRYPRPGIVKTRLAKQIGELPAALAYRACVQRLVNEFNKLPMAVRRYICLDGHDDIGPTRKWIGPGFRYLTQYNGDLGQRLEDVISTLLSHGNRKAIVMASDTPGISSKIIMQAAGLLDDNDIVIGPDKGGGYYLIGMKKMYYQLFQGISWSTSSVLSQTLELAAKLGLRTCLLPRLTDIDTAEDIMNYARQQPEVATELFGDLPLKIKRLKLDVGTSDTENGRR